MHRPHTILGTGLLIPFVACLMACSSGGSKGADRSPGPGSGSGWIWNATNPPEVMVKAENLYEGAAIGSPDVIRDGSRYLMTYAQGGRDSKGRIGLAESPDGLNWTRLNSGNPVLETGPSGSWDAWFLDTPCLLKVGATWYLFYYGASSNQTPGACVGLATSSDGIHWVKDPANPVLRPGANSDWDGLWVESPSVRWDGQAFQMLYTGVDAQWRVRIGHARSTDGRTWQKNSANPVLDASRPDSSGAGTWDDGGVGVPSLIQSANGSWEMFYSAQSAREIAAGLKAPKIGYATSTDLTHWTRDPANPLIGSELTGSRPNGPWAPSALFDPARGDYRVWYETGSGFSLVTGRRP